MLASVFIDKREGLCKAYNRGIIDKAAFHTAMCTLFAEAGVSKGVEADCEKADMVAHNYAHPEDRWI